jgi:predicted nucleotidyltransferase
LTDVPILRTFVSVLGTIPKVLSRDPAAVLFGSTRRRVLAWLLGHADEAYYLRQIARQTGAAVGAVQRELELLTAAGLVRRTVHGRQVYFQANRDAPVFPELRGLFAKTAGLLDMLRDALAPLGGTIQVALVFGSAARNELRPASDIDLLVVGDAPFHDVVHAIAAAQEKLGRDINPTVYPPHEFRAKLAAQHHFLTTVLREPRLFVVGGDDELVGLGAKRLVGKASDEPKRDSRTARSRRAGPRRQRR